MTYSNNQRRFNIFCYVLAASIGVVGCSETTPPVPPTPTQVISALEKKVIDSQKELQKEQKELDGRHACVEAQLLAVQYAGSLLAGNYECPGYKENGLKESAKSMGYTDDEVAKVVYAILTTSTTLEGISTGVLNAQTKRYMTVMNAYNASADGGIQAIERCREEYPDGGIQAIERCREEYRIKRGMGPFIKSAEEVIDLAIPHLAGKKNSRQPRQPKVNPIQPEPYQGARP